MRLPVPVPLTLTALMIALGLLASTARGDGLTPRTGQLGAIAGHPAQPDTAPHATNTAAPDR